MIMIIDYKQIEFLLIVKVRLSKLSIYIGLSDSIELSYYIELSNYIKEENYVNLGTRWCHLQSVLVVLVWALTSSWRPYEILDFVLFASCEHLLCTLTH